MTYHIREHMVSYWLNNYNDMVYDVWPRLTLYKSHVQIAPQFIHTWDDNGKMLYPVS